MSVDSENLDSSQATTKALLVLLEQSISALDRAVDLVAMFQNDDDDLRSKVERLKQTNGLSEDLATLRAGLKEAMADV